MAQTLSSGMVSGSIASENIANTVAEMNASMSALKAHLAVYSIKKTVIRYFLIPLTIVDKESQETLMIVTAFTLLSMLM